MYAVSPTWSRALLMVEGSMEDAVVARTHGHVAHRPEQSTVDEGLQDALLALARELDRIAAADPRAVRVRRYWTFFLDRSLELLRSPGVVRDPNRQKGKTKKKDPDRDDPDVFTRRARELQKGQRPEERPYGMPGKPSFGKFVTRTRDDG